MEKNNFPNITQLFRSFFDPIHLMILHYEYPKYPFMYPKYPYSPRILDSNGNAELMIKTSAQLAINCDSDVFLRLGRVFRINGIVYRPTNDVTPK
jgi:hypothetical protein